MTFQSISIFRDKCLLNGKWCDSKEKMPVYNPSSQKVIAQVPSMGASETKQAIRDATQAFSTWKQTSPMHRAKLLSEWHRLILDAKSSLAYIMSVEQGKPLAEASAEIDYAASYVLWFAEEAMRVQGEVLSSANPHQRLIVTRSPVGVCAAITPWNFPNAMITRKAAPALAAGCSIVIKPASETPLSALALAELAKRAGIPDGVLNVVVGSSGDIGSELTSNTVVRKLSFTGSTEVGKLLEAQCVPTLKKTSMELGGNAPFIVFDDADLDSAVQGALISKYRNSGQTCVCSNRILVQASIADAFVEKLVAATSALSLGNGLSDGVDLGPLVNNRAVHDVDALVKATVEAGARVALGGAPSELGGNFYQPTILTHVTPDMAVFRNEIFGPVAPVTVFQTEEEAIALANDTEFGLASYFYTRDIGRVWRVSEALDYGIVGVNEGIISNEMAPFGGVKQSGSGREGSKYGIEDYLEIKYVLMGGLA